MRHEARALTIVIAGLFLLAGCQPNCRDLRFPPGETSDYRLPYPVGQAHLVSQAHCNARGGHRDRIAVDFAMPMGATVCAARGGEVVEVLERYKDSDHTPGHNNRVVIRHEDGSRAWYAHLRKQSVTVEVGDRVSTGQPIGECGNSGRTGGLPHLHFEVFARELYNYSDAIPVSFRNARGPLCEAGGLLAGETYEAMPMDALP